MRPCVMLCWFMARGSRSLVIRRVLPAAVVAVSLGLLSASAQQTPDRDWPAITRETKPWTRWWWHGSAVERASLTAELAALGQAGIGGGGGTPLHCGCGAGPGGL